MFAALALILLLTLLLPFVLQNADDSRSTPSSSPTRSLPVVADAEGMVVSIDIERTQVTLKHGAIRELGMPAMTMVFHAANPAILAQVKPGDVVRFTITRTDNRFTVTQLVAT